MEKQYRTKYPSDASDGEWAFVAPSLTPVSRGRSATEHALREEFNGLSLHRAHRQPVAFHARQSAAMGSGRSDAAPGVF